MDDFSEPVTGMRKVKALMGGRLAGINAAEQHIKPRSDNVADSVFTHAFPALLSLRCGVSALLLCFSIERPVLSAA